MDNRYLEVVRRVEHHLAQGAATDKNAGQNLKSQIAERPWAIDFDSVADLYNSFYWIRNFWKAAYFFAYEYSLTPTTVNRLATQQRLDATFVGGGSGADVLAFITWFNGAFPLTRLHITVVDSSQKQLDTLALFMQKTAGLFDIEVSVRYLHMEASQWQPAPDGTDILVFGHFLVENPSDTHTLLDKSVSAVRRGGDVVVIERPNETVILHARQILADSGLTVHDVTTNPERMSLIQKGLPRPGHTGVHSHYLRATQPDHKLEAELVSQYFQAWRHRTAEPIQNIFGAQGSYLLPRRSQPIRGLSEMLAYWQANPVRQSNVTILLRNVAYTGNTAVCAFEGDFDTPTTHETIWGALCFDIDKYTRKIRHMTGHYGIHKTPR